MTIQKILIRGETKYDAAVITEVTVAAFESIYVIAYSLVPAVVGMIGAVVV
jgi:hypothetical protein